MTGLDPLLALLELEPLEVNLYRGSNRDLGTGRVFGGQVFAQALVAARRTVPEDRDAHSMHGYFLREGDLSAPIVYEVDRPRDGRSFTSRRVTAVQHGKAIFHLSASFHRHEDGLEHQIAMPDVPAPETLPDELDLMRERESELPAGRRAVLLQPRPIEIRPVPREGGTGDTLRDSYAPVATPGRAERRVWFRTRGALPDPAIIHQAVLAYTSDYGMLVTALQPHGIYFFDPRLLMASLDHTLWIHRPFRADDWLLYVVDAPSTAGARAFVRGQVFTRDGTLVASVAQEGLLRLRDGAAPATVS